MSPPKLCGFGAGWASECKRAECGGEGEPAEGRGPAEGAECQGEGRSLEMKGAAGQPGEPPEGRAGPRWVIDAEA